MFTVDETAWNVSYKIKSFGGGGIFFYLVIPGGNHKNSHNKLSSKYEMWAGDKHVTVDLQYARKSNAGWLYFLHIK